MCPGDNEGSISLAPGAPWYIFQLSLCLLYLHKPVPALPSLVGISRNLPSWPADRDPDVMLPILWTHYVDGTSAKGFREKDRQALLA